ncbi:MAG: hypothetical protein ACRDHZ_23850 [Ktedonobacteraceae bacterium]
MTEAEDLYLDFTARLSLLISQHPRLIVTTLSNVFTMRLIGNKTHGDLAEVAISEFINQFMYDFESQHVGKDLFRSKSMEEDILVRSLITGRELPISLKAYGDGPLQLSTDKDAVMFPLLEQSGVEEITDPKLIAAIFDDVAFKGFSGINVLPLIYDENKKKCNILVFDSKLAKSKTARIRKVSEGRGRRHPVWRFETEDDHYICEVRYGGASANALQRGLWTHTKNALPFFRSVTNGWIDYSHNLTLTELLAKALNASEAGHAAALREIENDLARIKEEEKIA